MLCRLGVMETERMYGVLNRGMNFKTTSLATWKKHTDGLAGEVTRSSQEKEFSSTNMMVSIVLMWGIGIRLGFKLTFHGPYFLYADCFQGSSDADF